MFIRSHFLSLAVAIALAASGWAQTQPPPGQGGQTPTPPPDGRGGSPTGNTPGNPGAVPQDQQMMDPYMTDKDFVKNVAE